MTLSFTSRKQCTSSNSFLQRRPTSSAFCIISSRSAAASDPQCSDPCWLPLPHPLTLFPSLSLPSPSSSSAMRQEHLPSNTYYGFYQPLHVFSWMNENVVFVCFVRDTGKDSLPSDSSAITTTTPTTTTTS
ncbi:hypothetical protein E2C01_008284 [Portunus trituberculatus]|uniref:Uncharacterized protein n=1 Tax=Portunus trituberculatus TaxID=210409 RepID=A0A5B7D0C5_PORTR|nr:hypothetical protein [Portunus trituberculatus]